MSRPGIISGGEKTIFRKNPTEANATSHMGVYARHPGVTPKYARNRGKRDSEFSDTIARIYVQLPGTLAPETFLESLPPESRILGEALALGAGNGGAGGTGFIDFILMSANEQFIEKTQIVNTLTDTYVAFYAGQEAPVFQYSGVVLNTYQDDQRVWMLRMYRDILRGTRLAQRGLLASLRYDSFIVRGYLENLTLNIQSSTQTSGSFSFSFRVKEMVIHTEALALPTTSRGLSKGVFGSLTVGSESSNTLRAASLGNINNPSTANFGPNQNFESEETLLFRRDFDKRAEDPLAQHVLGLANTYVDGAPVLVDPANPSNRSATIFPTATENLLKFSANPTDDGLRGLSNVRNTGPVISAQIANQLSPAEGVNPERSLFNSEADFRVASDAFFQERLDFTAKEQAIANLPLAEQALARKKLNTPTNVLDALTPKRKPPLGRGGNQIKKTHTLWGNPLEEVDLLPGGKHGGVR